MAIEIVDLYTIIYTLEMVMFHSFLYVYQRLVAGKNPRNAECSKFPRGKFFRRV